MTPELSGAASRAVQVATRAAVWVECRCGHAWQSRARDRMTIRCPECGTGQRVPYRTPENTGPSPERYLPPPPPPRTARVRPAPVWEPDHDPEDEWESDEPERPSLAAWMRNGGRDELVRAFPPGSAPGGLAGTLAALGGLAPAAPAPARRAAAPRPARPARPAAPNPPAVLPTAPAGAAVQPIDPQTLPEREQRRRDDVCQLARSLGASLIVWYNQPPGHCEALDMTQPRDRQRCPGTVTHAVRFRRDVTEADAYTCAAHARPLAAIADRAQYVSTAVYPLR
ncbi:hypothetical protein ACIBQ5_37360 [Streptomyces massasporeus]|uniref:hypothetical protein n=1 Tax=Streptomyces massasporeus TaxID=67324 RepID=UPI0037A3972B